MSANTITKCVAAVQAVVPDFDGMKKLSPATDEQIASLQLAIGMKLPADLIEWLKVLNGHNHDFVLSTGWTFLSTDEIKMHWEFFADPKAGIAPLIEHSEHMHRVKVPADHKTRIPFAADYAGNLLVIDMDPAAPQFAEQVLFVKRDAQGDAFVVFERFVELLDCITQQVTDGAIALVDGNIVFRNNPAMLRDWYIRARQFRNLPWSLTDDARAFAAALTAEQRSACYTGQNDLLQTEQFPAEDLDLVRSIVVNKELVTNADWLKHFPFLTDIRMDGDGNPAFFAVLAKLRLASMYLQPHTDDGLAGIEALVGNTTIVKMTAMRAEQATFDVFVTMPGLVQLSAIGSRVHDISGIAHLPKLRSLYINDIGQVDAGPAYQHPTLAEFSLTWRRS
jgi:cell wall assembly regulator SMI1